MPQRFDRSPRFKVARIAGNGQSTTLYFLSIGIIFSYRHLAVNHSRQTLITADLSEIGESNWQRYASNSFVLRINRSVRLRVYPLGVRAPREGSAAIGAEDALAQLGDRGRVRVCISGRVSAEAQLGRGDLPPRRRPQRAPEASSRRRSKQRRGRRNCSWGG